MIRCIFSGSLLGETVGILGAQRDRLAPDAALDHVAVAVAARAQAHLQKCVFFSMIFFIFDFFNIYRYFILKYVFLRHFIIFLIPIIFLFYFALYNLYIFHLFLKI